MLDLPPGKGEEEDLCLPHQYSRSTRTSWGDESDVLVGWGGVMAQAHLLIPADPGFWGAAVFWGQDPCRQ